MCNFSTGIFSKGYGSGVTDCKVKVSLETVKIGWMIGYPHSKREPCLDGEALDT